MSNAVVVVLLVVVVVAAVALMRRRASKGSACCGEHEAAPTRLKVADRHKNHYPYVTELYIGGMTCANCAIRVENALNVLPDTWAKVSIATKMATVRTKEEPDETAMRDAVASAGYVVLDDGFRGVRQGDRRSVT
jgi:copper chaperone CopZ